MKGQTKYVKLTYWASAFPQSNPLQSTCWTIFSFWLFLWWFTKAEIKLVWNTRFPRKTASKGINNDILVLIFQGLIFVVDSNDRERIAEANDELQKMVSHYWFKFTWHVAWDTVLLEFQGVTFFGLVNTLGSSDVQKQYQSFTSSCRYWLVMIYLLTIWLWLT